MSTGTESLERVTGPAVEPVSLTEAKAHLRVEIPDDDALISSLITALRERAEVKVRRALIAQTWDLTLDHWPRPEWPGGVRLYQSINAPDRTAAEIRITNPPLVSVVSIIYTDTAGNTTTLDPSAYAVLPGTPGRILPAYNTVWPSARSWPGAIVVRYTAGYGPDASFVPEGVKLWIKMLLAVNYENREQTIIGTTITELPSVDHLLNVARWGAYH